MTKLTEEKLKKLLKLYKSGYTAPELAEMFDISVGYVYLQASKAGVAKNKVQPQNIRSRVAHDYMNGDNIQDILKKYKISRKTLYRILKENDVTPRGKIENYKK